MTDKATINPLAAALRVALHSPLIRGALILVLVIALTATLAAAAPASIRLTREAWVEPGQVRLSEIAQLDGQAAADLADTVVASFEPNRSELKITRARVRQLLDEAGIAWGGVTLGGYAKCVVRVKPDPQPSAEKHDPPPAALLANPNEPVTTVPVPTLRDQLLPWIERHAGADLNSLRIEFAARDMQTLALPADADAYEIQPLASAPLGRVPVIIHGYRDGHPAASHRVTIDIARWCTAVVAARTISRGQTITPDDLRTQRICLTQDRGELATNPAGIVGQTAAAHMHTGAVLYAEDVRPPVVARRGELIEVRCLTGGLVIKTIARATETGSLGQIIQARNERSRESYPVRLTGPRQAVLLSHDAPAANHEIRPSP